VRWEFQEKRMSVRNDMKTILNTMQESGGRDGRRPFLEEPHLQLMILPTSCMEDGVMADEGS